MARHGSRSLSSPKYDVLTKLVWEDAARTGALTELGQRLGAKVDAVTAANQTLGYGLLSALGKGGARQPWRPGSPNGCPPC